jgi:hypothetical protein
MQLSLCGCAVLWQCLLLPAPARCPSDLVLFSQWYVNSLASEGHSGQSPDGAGGLAARATRPQSISERWRAKRAQAPPRRRSLLQRLAPNLQVPASHELDVLLSACEC